MIDAPCPKCGAVVCHERFADVVICEHCGAKLMTEHECHFDEEAGDSWCEDWLVEHG